MKRISIVAVTVCAVATVACDENVPTGTEPELFPVAPTTVTVVLPWSEFGADARVFGGFGSAADLSRSLVANGFEGVFDAKTLLRFEAPFDSDALVRNATGNLAISPLELIGADLVLRFDSADVADFQGEFQVAMTRTPWDERTATWTLASGGVSGEEPWPVPGAGDSEPLGSTGLDGLEEDSLVFQLDSVTVAELGDTTNAARGLAISLLSEGWKIPIRTVTLRVHGRAVIDPDTVVTQAAVLAHQTFIFDPEPTAEDDALLVGGVPAWRTVLSFDFPETIDGPAELCAVVSCPFALDPTVINVASLILTTGESPPGFLPEDTLQLDAREALAPERLPKSPLGGSFFNRAPFFQPVEPGAFVEGGSREVAIPVTGFIRDEVARDPSDPGGSVALLSFLEPLSFDVARFRGVGEEGEPFLRILMTLVDTIQVR